MKDKPIGVFDSGLGGLTVVKELRRVLPGEKIVYLGDTARVPYGTRSAEIIKQFGREDVRFLKSKGVKMVVVACNTVSAVALREVEEEAGAAVFSVVKAGVRAVAKLGGGKRVGVIGTRATIESGAYRRGLERMGEGWQVKEQACPLMVSIVEEGEIEGEVAEVVVRNYMKDLGRVEVLVLGCTHFPLLRKVMRRIVGEEVVIVNPAEELAREVREFLVKKKWVREGQGEVEYYVTDLGKSFVETAEMFLGERVRGRVEKVKVG